MEEWRELWLMDALPQAGQLVCQGRKLGAQLPDLLLLSKDPQSDAGKGAATRLPRFQVVEQPFYEDREDCLTDGPPAVSCCDASGNRAAVQGSDSPESTGASSRRFCADAIYRTLGNKKFYNGHGIRLVGRARKTKAEEIEGQTLEQQKLFKSKLKKRSVIETSRSVIEMAFFMVNAEKILRLLHLLFVVQDEISQGIALGDPNNLENESQQALSRGLPGPFGWAKISAP